MRLLKLALVFLFSLACMAQVAPDLKKLPSHSPNQLLQRYSFAVRGRPFVRPMNPDARMNLLGAISNVPPNTCFKLRKYIFEPKEQVEKKGMLPLGDTMVQVGETDCTYANKVWPKSADGKPLQPQMGVYSTVVRTK